MDKAPPDSPTYRDALPGAEAKRDDLLNRARAELAAQPLEVRRVFVDRISTAAAGFTLVAGGVFTALIAASPDMYADLGSILPGKRPAVAVSVLASTLFLTMLAYFVARAAAEERFTRAMLRVANPSGDVFLDIERLRHTPTKEALRLAERARRPARYAFTAGLAAVATPLAVAAGSVIAGRGWSNPGLIDATLVEVGSAMLQASLLTIIATALIIAIKRPIPLAVGLGILGVILAPYGGALAVWGVTLVGLSAGLGFITVRSKRQAGILAFARARL